MDNINILRGLYHLKRYLPDEALHEFSNYERGMVSLLHRRRLYGKDRVPRSEMDVLVADLNTLAYTHCHQTFTALCDPPPQAKPHMMARSIDNQATARVVKQRLIPEVEIELLTYDLPTALCSQYTVRDYPFITIHIDNTDNHEDVNILMRASIAGYSHEDRKTVHVARGDKQRTSLLPRLIPQAITHLHDMELAPLYVTIEFPGHAEKKIEETKDIRLHARNRALLATQGPGDTEQDLTRYLAAWVTPRHPAIKNFISEVAKSHPDGLLGYRCSVTFCKVEDSVRSQVQAMVTILQQRGFVYVASSPPSGEKDGYFSQTVRLPHEVLETGGSANCLDGALLFASLLEGIGIEPLIVLLPGHALVGWRVTPERDDYEFLDTTVLSEGDFAAAQIRGNEYIDQIGRESLFRKKFLDLPPFSCVIDIAACRHEGVIPLTY